MKRILCVMLLGLMSFKASAQSEADKWAYVKKEIATSFDKYQGLTHSVGSFLKNWAPLFSIPAAIFVTSVKTMELNDAWRRNYDNRNWRIDNGNILGFLKQVESIFYGLVAGVGVQGLCKFVGSMLENEEELCLKAVEEFIFQWPQHKAQSPEMLYPIFDRYTITKPTGKEAKAFVEKVLLLDYLLAA